MFAGVGLLLKYLGKVYFRWPPGRYKWSYVAPTIQMALYMGNIG